MNTLTEAFPPMLPIQTSALNNFFARGGGWKLISLGLAALVLMPLLVLGSTWLSSETEIWQHLLQTVLPELLRNTVVLLVGVGIGVSVIGVGLAWLTAMCEFPGRRFFDWGLMLPLAIPAYVLAFVVVGLFDYSGIVQTLLRQWFGSSLWFPAVRSEKGVILVMVLALYPYIYMLTRVAFLGQGQRMMEAARSLGASPLQAFYHVALPMARPAIAAGVSLALMETLADFGTVTVFNYNTFTTAIYKAWISLFNLHAAAQLATLLLLFVIIALLMERYFRGRARYHTDSRRQHRYQLRGWKAFGATAFASVIFACAFLIPMLQLIVWVWKTAARDLDYRYVDLLINTISLGGIAAFLTVLGALLLGFSQRIQRKSRSIRFAVSVATMGYALPGSVLAVGVMLSFVWIDNQLQTFFISIGLGSYRLLTGGIIALVLAYIVRFMAVAFGSVDSGLHQIRPSLQDAARSLGATHRDILQHLYFPLLRPGLFAGFLLVLVDVMKEMPATLLLRPFGWDTLAVRIYEMTAEGEWERAALPALTLVLVGLLPVIFLVKRSARLC
ncbi:ABC transporter permease [Beggiatoa leptomitoformis]|uniref:ABC transporter permease subunit n=1 Tax=Beggiatoa leptomitoformis TaxID=288004 RepID=A0A2N9YJF9_9GAMM|nr:iron ABC transporter permease [Beggiatoa leptomitoformis]ALG69468.2 ABC transporter permease subunit [Beggiatoa leptomitoformis]AUI70623.2 ABC transporter permease subunit [Beggiatoa leptomitoformis]